MLTHITLTILALALLLLLVKVGCLKRKMKQLQSELASARINLVKMKQLQSELASARISLLMHQALTEDELLAALQAGGASVDHCMTVLGNAAVGEKVLNWVAAQGPLDVLGNLVAMEQVQGKPAQATAQKRLQEAARKREQEVEHRKRREHEEEQREREQEESQDDSDYYEKGNCDCRWR